MNPPLTAFLYTSVFASAVAPAAHLSVIPFITGSVSSHVSVYASKLFSAPAPLLPFTTSPLLPFGLFSRAVS